MKLLTYSNNNKKKTLKTCNLIYIRKYNNRLLRKTINNTCKFPYICYSLFRYHVIDQAFLTWMFFTPLWRTIKNSDVVGGGREYRLQKIITKWKRNKYLKMPSFCAVNYSNCANREKDKSKYRFSSIVKNNSKRSLNFRKWERAHG